MGLWSAGVKVSSVREAGRAQEDASRIEGDSSAFIVYHVPEKIVSVLVDAFLTTPARDGRLTIATGATDSSFAPSAPERLPYEPYPNTYQAFCPVRYTVKLVPGQDRFLRIGLSPGVQVGRVEICYGSEE